MRAACFTGRMSSSPIDVAFTAVARADFLPSDRRSRAGDDNPLPIGGGQTNSQPRTVRDMLQLLDVHPGVAVLDVGAGSGWTTALLGHLVGPEGRVVGVELDPTLATWGAGNLAKYDMAWTSLEQARSGVLGRPEHAPYDRILVSAEATELPQQLVGQLTDNGVMVLPISGTMTRVCRRGPETDDVEISTHGSYRFVPLR